MEFLRASQSGRGRIIRLNHSPGALPPQLAGRLQGVAEGELGGIRLRVEGHGAAGCVGRWG